MTTIKTDFEIVRCAASGAERVVSGLGPVVICDSSEAEAGDDYETILSDWLDAVDVQADDRDEYSVVLDGRVMA